MTELLAALLTLAALPAFCQPLAGFSYTDTDTARAHWSPRFGSLPVRVERLAGGTTCLALDADFHKQGDRACWDWSAPLDLSKAEAVAFEVSAENGGLGGNIGMYFGTPKGWYCSFWWGGVPDNWTLRMAPLADFDREGQPDGWDKVTTFRFSIWATGPGKTTYRLRNLRLMPADPARNILLNGSFECPGVGVPYGWGSGHWGVGEMPWAAQMDLWRTRWGLDSGVAKDGNASLRIRNTADMPLLRATSVWVTPPATVKECVLSAWLKADGDALPVALECGGRSVSVSVGKQWQQAVLPGIPRAEQMIPVIAPKAPGTLWIDAVQLQAGTQATADFHPSLGDEALMAREALVDWSPPRRTAQVAPGRATSGPVAPAKVAIDAHGRYLLDGKPYLQHSLGLEFISDLAILDFVARSGFRNVCIEINAGVTTERLREILDRCAAAGLRVIPWLDGNIARERFVGHITALRGHPALLCWYVYDEPSGPGFEEAQARLKLAKELDPSVPALINYLGDKLTDQRGDIYSTDVYPIPHSAPNAAISAVAQMAAAAEKEHKPVWMWLQGTGYAYWMAREPTPRELSCMVYGSLIAGARGIYYFAQVPRTKQCFDEMRALCVETETLEPVLGSLDSPPLTCDRPQVMAKAFAHQGELWVLAVNTGMQPTEPTFTLHGAAGNGAVEFEGRAVQAREGHWTDSFGPYERHVYRFRPAGV